MEEIVECCIDRRLIVYFKFISIKQHVKLLSCVQIIAKFRKIPLVGEVCDVRDDVDSRMILSQCCIYDKCFASSFLKIPLQDYGGAPVRNTADRCCAYGSVGMTTREDYRALRCVSGVTEP